MSLAQAPKKTCIGIKTGSAAKDFHYLQYESFYKGFMTDLYASVNETHLDTDDVAAFVKKTWYKNDYWSNHKNMQMICTDSNEGPIPWTEEMRTFKKDGKYRSYESMDNALADSVVDNHRWEQLKTAAKAKHQAAILVKVPQYTSAKGLLGPAKPRPQPSPASAAKGGKAKKAVPVAAASDDEEEEEDDQDPPPPPPPRKRRSSTKGKANPGPVAAVSDDEEEEDDQDPPALSRADIIAKAASPLFPPMAEEKHIKVFKHACRVLAILSPDQHKLQGYIAVPVSEDDDMQLADKVGSCFNTFSQFTMAPAAIADRVKNVFESVSNRELIYDSFQTAMHMRVVKPYEKAPSEHPALNKYSIPYECADVYARCAATVYQARGDKASRKDIETLMPRFQDLLLLQAHIQFLEDLDGFSNYKSVEQKRTRHKIFSCMTAGYPKNEYMARLKNEHEAYIAQGGYVYARNAIMNDIEWKSQLDLYQELLPLWDKKAYTDTRDLIYNGGLLLINQKLDEFARFEEREGRLDDLCAKHSLMGLFQRFQREYSMYVGFSAHFGKKQPEKAHLELLHEPVDMSDEEKLILAVFIAENVSLMPEAKHGMDHYLPYAEELAVHVRKSIPDKIESFDLDTFVMSCDFANCPVRSITDAYVDAVKTVHYNPNGCEGTIFLEKVLQNFDASIASLQARPAAKKGGKQKKVQIPADIAGDDDEGSPPVGESSAPLKRKRGDSRAPSSGQGSPPVGESSAPLKRKRGDSRAPSSGPPDARERLPSCFIVEDNILPEGGRRSRAPSTFLDPSSGLSKVANNGKARK
jgi:hypothetical protein